MKVSIIIPVFNVSKFINRCLQSVIKQTYTDIECILIDDCGNDNSIELIQQFINDYHGNVAFHILHHKTNRGQSAARNTGIRHATGEYLFFLDSDDFITNDCIEQLIKLAKEHPDVDFTQGNVLDENGDINKYGWNSVLPEYVDKHDIIENYLLSVVVTSAWNKVIKKEFLTKNNLYFPEGIIHEDLYWSFFLAKLTKAVAFTNHGTYIYCNNENSTITSVSKNIRIKRYTSRLYASKAFCAALDKEKKASKRQRLFIAGNLTCAMIEVAALHSLKHWCTFWRHVCRLYVNHSKLTFWQHILFLFLMPPLCFPIGIKAWYWRLQRYIVNNI